MFFDSVRPQLSDTTTEIIYVEQSEFLASLRLTLIGATSNLHVWDPQRERFTLRGAPHDKSGVLSIISRDETITQRLASLHFQKCSALMSFSCLSRFLAIGTLSRRLEILVTSLGQRYVWSHLYNFPPQIEFSKRKPDETRVFSRT